MSAARRSFYGRCEDACRRLGRWSLVVPQWFDRMADWFAERAR